MYHRIHTRFRNYIVVIPTYSYSITILRTINRHRKGCSFSIVEKVILRNHSGRSPVILLLIEKVLKGNSSIDSKVGLECRLLLNIFEVTLLSSFGYTRKST